MPQSSTHFRQRCREKLAKLPALPSSVGSFDSVRLRLSALRCNENKKGVPPRVEYVLEAQALKEARDDPRWRRSSPEILLHDGLRNKREVIAIGGRKQRAVSTEALLSAVSRPSGGGSGRGLRFLAGVSRSGGTGSEAPGAGASAASKGDCFGQVEERPGRFGDAGAFAALRFIAGIMEGGPGH